MTLELRTVANIMAGIPNTNTMNVGTYITEAEVGDRTIQTLNVCDPQDRQCNAKEDSASDAMESLFIHENDRATVMIETYEERARILKNKGNDLFKSGDLAAAIEKYSEAIEVLDSTPAGHGHKVATAALTAQCLSNRAHVTLIGSEGSQADAALADATRAIELDPAYSKAYHRKASALDALGRHKEATVARFKAEEREKNAKRDAASVGMAEDNVLFKDLAGGKDPLSRVLKAGELSAVNNEPFAIYRLGDKIEKAQNKELRKGNTKLYYAIALRTSITYFNALLFLAAQEETIPNHKKKEYRKMLGGKDFATFAKMMYGESIANVSTLHSSIPFVHPSTRTHTDTQRGTQPPL